MNSNQIDKRLKNLESTITARTSQKGMTPYELSLLSAEELWQKLFTSFDEFGSDSEEIKQLLEDHPWIEKEYAAYKDGKWPKTEQEETK